MTKYISHLVLLLLVFTLSCLNVLAEDGYFYGIWKGHGHPNHYKFGRIDLATNEKEIIDDSLRFYPSSRAAIDTRRGNFVMIHGSESLHALDLKTGARVGAWGRRPEFAYYGNGFIYNHQSDRFYIFDWREGAVAVNPEDWSVEDLKVPVEKQGNHKCKAFDGLRNWFVVDDNAGFNETEFELFDEDRREVLHSYITPNRLNNWTLHPSNGLIYAVVGLYDPEAGESQSLLIIDPVNGTEERHEIIQEASVYAESGCGLTLHPGLNRLLLSTSDGFHWLDLSTYEYEYSFGVGHIDFLYGRLYVPPAPADLVSGQVYSDLNNNCLKDGTDAGFAGKLVEFLPGPHRAYAGTDGRYSLYLPQGTFEAQVKTEWPWKGACENATHQIISNADGSIQGDLDFGLAPIELFKHLELNIVSSNAAAGREIFYHIRAVNTGTVPFDGKLRFTYDPILEELNSVPEASRHTVGIAEWDINSLPIGATLEIEVTLKVPEDETLRGQEICARVELVKYRDDLLAGLRQDEICNIIRASYDPNDISVAPRGFGNSGVITAEDSTLAYTIRFQNIGDAPARDVIIRDTLDGDLDVNTLHFGAASHAYTVSVMKQNIIEFRFANIELPGKQEDEPASHGAVKYKVNLNKGLPRSTQIHNRAGIYFDFNKPVITNTVVNTIGEATTDVIALGNSNPLEDKLELRSLGQGRFVCHLDPSLQHLSPRLSVFSVLGTQILESPVLQPNAFEIDLSQQASGRYLIRLQVGEQSIVKTVVVIN